MTDAEVRRILASSRFQELERRRGRFSWTLTAIMLVAYAAFILLVAFAHGLVATQISGVITLAFPMGLGVIILAIVLTGLYVVRANGEFDRLTRDITAESALMTAPQGFGSAAE